MTPVRLPVSRAFLPVGCGRPRRTRGKTFVELLIAIVIFSLISVFLVSVVMIASQISSNSLSAIRTESKTRYSMDMMRRHLMKAALNSVVVSNNGRTVRFTDPTRIVPDPNKSGSTTLAVSEISLETIQWTTPQGKTLQVKGLVYTPVTWDSTTFPVFNIPGIDDAEFSLLGTGNMLRIRLTARTTRFAGRGEGTVASPITMTEEIMLRNLPL